MSGGSWEYLFLKDAAELVGNSEILSRMADRLDGLHYAIPAARDTRELIAVIDEYNRQASELVSRLQEVWRAVEWWDSGDSGESAVIAAMEPYRESYKKIAVEAERRRIEELELSLLERLRAKYPNT